MTATTDPLSLGLVGNALALASHLSGEFPGLVYTSGRRGVPEQASAMAANVKRNRKWIVQTYRETASSHELQAYVDAHPEVADFTQGFVHVMLGWTDEQKALLSDHFSGHAFDLQPLVDPKGNPTAYGNRVLDAARTFPGVRQILLREGGLIRWHISTH